MSGTTSGNCCRSAPRPRSTSRQDEIEDHIFSEKFLLQRPLLEAIRQDKPAVLLIDEIDRADEEFEAYLLEILSDFQITIPGDRNHRGDRSRPHVILTANGARDLSDALRRRCLYNYVDYPDRRTEMAIVAKRCPALEDRLAEQIVGFVQALRKEELEKKPGIAEMLDWAAALAGLGVNDLADDPEQTQATLVCLLKTERDRAAVPREVQQRLVGKAAVMQVTRFPGTRYGGPAERLAGFMAHLRLNGIPAGLGETETALAALGAVDAKQ
jgi:MoxR-like ATPase